MKIKMYVLCLLKFKDGEIVFNGDELTSIKDAIEKGLQNQNLFAGYEPGDTFKVYCLNREVVQTWVGESATIELAEIGYYHHRVIVYLKLDSVDDFSKLREVRDKLKEPIYNMIKCGVKDQIYELICNGKIRKEALVEFFYTYPLIVVGKRPRLRQLVDKMIKCSVKTKKQEKKLDHARKIRKEAIVKFFTYPLIILKRCLKSSEAFPFSEETGSLCFDIVEPSWFPPTGKRHLMRVSIPSTILYTQGEAGKDLLRDIVNATYQYCLYEQKAMDVSRNFFENVLDESLQVKLWTHITDCMGGRSIDVHVIRLTHATCFLAVLAIIISIISLVVP